MRVVLERHLNDFQINEVFSFATSGLLYSCIIYRYTEEYSVNEYYIIMNVDRDYRVNILRLRAKYSQYPVLHC